ncbi:MAG TPA: PDZ domain-containing protein [Candidatus Limiplasma sp.]|nr:PDZ domain-containing protein [Candidatus Limiplasma sp.]HRX08650.1 PDZ domain-containing protein [Candidatus Limiplasma sp.]
MKRILSFVFAFVFFLILCAAYSPALAQSDPEALLIKTISVTIDGDSIVLEMELFNAGNSAIDAFALALAFVDENGYQVYGYDDTLDGYAQEVCNWYYEPEPAIAAGQSYYTKDTFANYQEAKDIAVAIRYYHAEDSDYILFSEEQWQWIWSGYEEQSGTLVREYYTSPSDQFYDSIGDYDPGYHYSILDNYNAYYYGKPQGGEWLTTVTPGSPAANAGLRSGDLILFVDGVSPTQNLYAVEYAMAKIVAGETVDWVYERDGLIYVTRLGKE